MRIKVEPKSEVKAKLGHSPDLSDAAFIAIDLARSRFGLVSMDPPKKSNDDGMSLFMRRGPTSFKDLDVVSRSSHAHLS